MAKFKIKMLFKITLVAKVVFWINSLYFFSFLSPWQDLEICDYFIVHHWFAVSWLPLRKQICMWRQLLNQNQQWLSSLSHWRHVFWYLRAGLATTCRWCMDKEAQTIRTSSSSSNSMTLSMTFSRP